MTVGINDTHGASLRSWLESANDAASDLPIQNLPLGRFRRDRTEPWRLGAAIGDCIVDLRQAGLVAFQDVDAVLAADLPARQLALA